MSKFLGSQKLTLTCGQCGHKTQQTITRLESSPQITCPSCGVVTEYDARQFRSEIAKTNKAIDKLGKSLKKFGKR